MDDNTELLIEQRLSVFSDEPDLNDWFEVMCGAAMAVLGLFHLVEPGELVDPDMMRWFAASVIAAGAVWAGRAAVRSDAERSSVQPRYHTYTPARSNHSLH